MTRHSHDDHGHGHAEHDDHHDHDDHDHGRDAHDSHAHGGHDDDHGHDDHAGHDHHGHDDHGHGHGGHAHDFREASRRSLIIALILITGYMFAEVIGGVLSGSLALIADAGHMLTDAAAIGLALLAMWLAGREASTTRTWGFHRTEVLAAMINALALWMIAAWIVFEAVERFRHHDHHIEGGLMMAVGIGGLIVNIIAAWILHASSEHSMNVEGAFQHVVADLLGSIGVVVSGILIIAFGWTIADPIISIVIALLIVLGSWRLVAQVVHVLLEGTPDRIDMYRLCYEMGEVEGVTVIHDVHCSTITSGYEALTAHVLIDPGYDGEMVDKTLRELRRIANQDFGIAHVTLQVEQSVEGCTEEDHHVGHLLHEARPT